MREVSGGTTSPLTYFVTIYMHFLLRKQIPVLRPYISCMSPIQFVKIGQGCSTPLSFPPLQNVVAILKKGRFAIILYHTFFIVLLIFINFVDLQSDFDQ